MPVYNSGNGGIESLAYQSGTLQIFGMLGGQVDTVFRIKMCTAFDYVAALRTQCRKTDMGRSPSHVIWREKKRQVAAK